MSSQFLGKYESLQAQAAEPDRSGRRILDALGTLTDHVHILIDTGGGKEEAVRYSLSPTLLGAVYEILPNIVDKKKGPQFLGEQETNKESAWEKKWVEHNKGYTLRHVQENRERYSDFAHLVYALQIIETALQHPEVAKDVIRTNSRPADVKKARAAILDLQGTLKGRKLVVHKKGEAVSAGLLEGLGKEDKK